MQSTTIPLRMAICGALSKVINVPNLAVSLIFRHKFHVIIVLGFTDALLWYQGVMECADNG